MRTSLSILSLLMAISLCTFAQIPPNYYNSANGLKGANLKLALHKIIRNHTQRSYANLWTDFETTDKKTNGKVWDMYSDNPTGSPAYEFTFGSNQCGNYSTEGDCYNREHSFPKSWWGGNQDTMYTDLFHLVPTDGYVNGKRANFCYGEVSSPTWTSTNGSKLGPCSFSGYTGTVFEPIDEYKGDFARAYFYMATRYTHKIKGWNSDMLAGDDFAPWALNLLHQWHLQDTVNQKELDRNDAIYSIQGNRNPFIDQPLWVDSIWFDTIQPPDTTAILSQFQTSSVHLFPNPSSTQIHIQVSGVSEQYWTACFYTIQGIEVKMVQFRNNDMKINIQNLESGFYLIKLTNEDFTVVRNLKWIKE